MTNCGPTDVESCCTSLEVTGGTFLRSYDGVSSRDAGNPATVSGFRLDKYEVTVGRFRQFVTAVDAGWKPAAGSGKHTHLNGGQGLVGPNVDAGQQYETGWATSWNSQISMTSSDWNNNLQCDSNPTWTPIASTQENEPINCVTWYESYAFCIWDGAFLPSEAEWNYAASGGSDQRVYPWSSPPTSTAIGCTYANYSGADGGAFCADSGPNNVGTEPMGDGYNNKWGQSDMAGNIWEFSLDWFASAYLNPCTDCANLAPGTSREVRGGSFRDDTVVLLVSLRGNPVNPTGRWDNIGPRCARTP